MYAHICTCMHIYVLDVFNKEFTIFGHNAMNSSDKGKIIKWLRIIWLKANA